MYQQDNGPRIEDQLHATIESHFISKLHYDSKSIAVLIVVLFLLTLQFANPVAIINNLILLWVVWLLNTNSL